MKAARSLRVFVVEDEAFIVMELVDMLEELGHVVIGPAASVERALRLLQDLNPPPDVAIVDANLGGEISSPVVDQLKASNIPVVLSSGYEASELARMGLVGTLMRKPYSMRLLANTLDRLA
jgi:CheY-like chemotaxis protein